MDSFSLQFEKETDGREMWGQRSLTLQQGRCRGYSLRDPVHTVNGLEELWDTIILVRYQHLNLISASVMGGEEGRGDETTGEETTGDERRETPTIRVEEYKISLALTTLKSRRQPYEML